MLEIIPPKQGPKNYKTRSIRIDKTILDRIDEIHEQLGESANYIIEKLLEYALEQYDKSEQKPARKS